MVDLINLQLIEDPAQRALIEAKLKEIKTLANIKEVVLAKTTDQRNEALLNTRATRQDNDEWTLIIDQRERCNMTDRLREATEAFKSVGSNIEVSSDNYFYDYDASLFFRFWKDYNCIISFFNWDSSAHKITGEVFSKIMDKYFLVNLEIPTKKTKAEVLAALFENTQESIKKNTNRQIANANRNLKDEERVVKEYKKKVEERKKEIEGLSEAKKNLDNPKKAKELFYTGIKQLSIKSAKETTKSIKLLLHLGPISSPTVGYLGEFDLSLSLNKDGSFQYEFFNKDKERVFRWTPYRTDRHQKDCLRHPHVFGKRPCLGGLQTEKLEILLQNGKITEAVVLCTAFLKRVNPDSHYDWRAQWKVANHVLNERNGTTHKIIPFTESELRYLQVSDKPSIEELKDVYETCLTGTPRKMLKGVKQNAEN